MSKYMSLCQESLPQFHVITLNIIILLRIKFTSLVELIVRLITHELFTSFVVIQFIVGALIPMVLIVIGKKLSKARIPIYTIASLLTLIGIFAMRWNIIIGGQMISKSMAGIVQYHLAFFGREGIMMAIAIMVVPFVLLAVLTKVLPPWEEEYA